MQIVTRIITLFIITCASINPGCTQVNGNCGLERFQCHNGECIAGELLCDGKADCKDQSDETVTKCTTPEILCPEYAFRCKYGACVNGDAACNGIKDCIDNSDETLPRCATGTDNRTERPVRCDINEFTCDNGQCIRNIDVCDGISQCADGSDETFARCGSLTCLPTAFRCAYGACIDGDQRCNGVINCADGSDEDSKCGGTTWPFSPGTTPTPVQISPSPVTPVTDTRFCKAPSQPPNGNWKLHRSQCPSDRDCDIPEGVELQLGSHLVYSCNSGYKIRGHTDVSCSFQGKWLNIPVCTEIRCTPLSTASTDAACTYNDDWVSCESPVLPRTIATLTCRDSYRREGEGSFTTQRDRVRCDVNGQWEPQPIRCIPGPHSINIYLNDNQLVLRTTLNGNNSALIEILSDKIIIHTNLQNSNHLKTVERARTQMDAGRPSGKLTENPWVWSEP